MLAASNVKRMVPVHASMSALSAAGLPRFLDGRAFARQLRQGVFAFFRHFLLDAARPDQLRDTQPVPLN